MYRIITKPIKDIWAGISRCPKCGAVAHFHLMRVKTTVYLFFIPLFFCYKERLLVCDDCNVCIKLNEKEYKKIRKKQMLKLKNDEIPSKIILEDYNPDELEITKHFYRTLFISLYSFMMDFLLLDFVPISEMTVEDFFVLLIIFVAMGNIHFIVSLKGLLSKIKKLRIYEKHKGK